MQDSTKRLLGLAQASGLSINGFDLLHALEHVIYRNHHFGVEWELVPLSFFEGASNGLGIYAMGPRTSVQAFVDTAKKDPVLTETLAGAMALYLETSRRLLPHN